MITETRKNWARESAKEKKNYGAKDSCIYQGE